MYEYEYRVQPMTHRAMYILQTDRLSCRDTQWTGVDGLCDPLPLLSILPWEPGSPADSPQDTLLLILPMEFVSTSTPPPRLPRLSSSTPRPPILS